MGYIQKSAFLLAQIFVFSLIFTFAQTPITQQKRADDALLRACLDGDLFLAEGVLRAGANVNVQNSDGKTPLMFAAQKDNVQMIDLLLQSGAKAVMQNDKGEYAIDYLPTTSTGIKEKLEAAMAKDKSLAEEFMQAIWNNNTNQALELLKAGAYVDYKDKSFKEQATPLMIALYKNNVELVKALVKAGARLERADLYGATAFFYATSKEAAEILFDAGANVNSVNLEGHTPLHIAADKGDVEVVKFLLTKNVIVDKETKLHATALHYAANNLHSEIIAALLKAGADPNKKSDKGYTALMLVAGKGDLARVNLLLQNGADANLTNNDGETALVLAQKYKQTEIAAFLEKSTKTPPSPKIVDTVKQDVLSDQAKMVFKAVSKKLNWSELEKLLKAGFSPNVRNEKGETPLMIATDNEDVDQMYVLISFSADINAQDNEGMTALMRAVANDNLASTIVLIKKGAKKDIKDKKGRTALSIAKVVSGKVLYTQQKVLEN